MKEELNQIIDLRSDTVSSPSLEMLESIRTASLHDSYFEDDPTTKELEKYTSNLFGFEDALLTNSATMVNLIALKVNTEPGDTVITDEAYHLNYYEASGVALISGVTMSLTRTQDGIIEPEIIEELLYKRNKCKFNSKIKLISLENTINYFSGKIYPESKLLDLAEYSREKDWKIHLDGARIFNALLKTNTNFGFISKICDSLTLSLTKGLAAPAGGILLGNKEFIQKAKIINKWIGGGMHQSGVIAQMGLYGIKNNIEQISVDNNNAQILSKLLKNANLENVKISDPDTNIVIINLSLANIPSIKVIKELDKENVKLHEWSEYSIRAVTHKDISFGDIGIAANKIISVINRALSYV